MKLKLLVVVTIVMALGACKCPPGLNENLDNVSKIASENDELRTKAGVSDPDGIKAGRNKAAVDLAKKLVEECK